MYLACSITYKFNHVRRFIYQLHFQTKMVLWSIVGCTKYSSCSHCKNPQNSMPKKKPKLIKNLHLGVMTIMSILLLGIQSSFELFMYKLNMNIIALIDFF